MTMTSDAPSIDDDRLTETFAALANPTRRAILARLAAGEATVNELAAPFSMTLPAISKHIKVLERAGLVVRSHRAQYRPCRLDPSPLEEIAHWTEHYRPVCASTWTASLSSAIAQPAAPGESDGTPTWVITILVPPPADASSTITSVVVG